MCWVLGKNRKTETRVVVIAAGLFYVFVFFAPVTDLLRAVATAYK
jgi:hypothetical protein